MKFSILLPTRNRLDLLKFAIESVRSQDYPAWEIDISDNASEDDIAAYVQSLGDSRILYSRQDALVPVTDNWNAALHMATGDYVIMLGDDDALVPNALTGLHALLEAWGMPDAIYAQARQYAYPMVIPWHPEPFMQTGCNVFLEDRKEAFLLSRDEAISLVRAAADFRILFGFNMQHLVFGRRLLDKMRSRGEFFQSPYPDYYAINAAFLDADKLVASPRPFVMIGISPKSFGFYYFNSRESEGNEFLKNVADPEIATALKKSLVPGSNMNDSWLCAMQTLANRFPEFRLKIGFARYRRFQYHAMLGSGRGRELWRHMRWWEYPVCAMVLALFSVCRLLPGAIGHPLRSIMLHALTSPAPYFDPAIKAVPYRNIIEAVRGKPD